MGDDVGHELADAGSDQGHGVGDAAARLRQGNGEAVLKVSLDDGVPDGCVRVAAAHMSTRMLGPMFGPIAVEPA